MYAAALWLLCHLLAPLALRSRLVALPDAASRHRAAVPARSGPGGVATGRPGSTDSSNEFVESGTAEPNDHSDNFSPDERAATVKLAAYGNPGETEAQCSGSQ